MTPSSIDPDVRYSALAIALFALALVTPFHEVWREDLRVVVPMFPRFEGEMAQKRAFWKWIGETEQRFVAWQVVRNARVLHSRPWDLFETEQCHPTRHMMALGEPMIALGVVGIPFSITMDDPIAIYNWILASIIMIAALAMYLLVRDWTASPAAGIVAALLYAFHPDKLADINHYYIHDTAWTVLALFFAHRFFQRGGYANAISLALCCAMQMAGSFYPFVGAVLLAGPMAVWLIHRHGIRRLELPAALTAFVVIAIAGYFIFSPYLAMRSSDALIARSDLHFALWSEILPGGGRFPGWIALLLVAIGALGIRRDRPFASPHFALALGCLIILFTTIGGSDAKHAPLLYRMLANVVPGLDAIRRPNEILSVFHLGFTILAGLGCAALLARIPPPHRQSLAFAIIALTFVTTVRPGWLGFESPVVYRALDVRPSEAELAFFAELARRGSDGPILEVPRGQFHVEAHRLLLSGFHGRRVSSCVNELQPEAYEVAALVAALPEDGAITQLAEMGFTTIVVHHPPADASARATAIGLRKLARRQPELLLQLHATMSASAFEIQNSR